ncbi:unnamed protein product [Prunus armeniaca]
MDDQSNLMRQFLNQMSLAQNLGFGQLGEEKRMDDCTGRQLDRYQAGRAGVSIQDEGQQRDRPLNMSQASASHTQSRLSLRKNVRKRLGPLLDIRARLSSQGNVHQRLGPQGGQLDNHRNEDREERRSAVHSQRSIHERLGPQGGQLDNPHNEDYEERSSATHSRRVDSRWQATENPSQGQSTNTPPRQRRREGRPSQTNEELVNDRLRDLKTGGNFEDALCKEMDQAISTHFTAEVEQAAPPKRFSTPSFTHFKGDSDPESHL